MYFLIHAQILADTAPITAQAYQTMVEALSALYTGMAYDVAAEAVLRSWAKVMTETGQVLKDESYVKVSEPENTTSDTYTDNSTADTSTDSSTATESDSATTNMTEETTTATDSETTTETDTSTDSNTVTESDSTTN